MQRARPQLTVVVLALSSLFLFVARARADTITVATYNIEHFQTHFYAHEITPKLPKPLEDPIVKEMLAQLRKMNDEDNWEVAQVILDDRFEPDVLVIQEGCDQANLEYFNKRWLRSAYETVLTFPTNTGERHQHLNMLLKPGFKVLDRRDKYHQEKDPVANERGGLLFARGPAFCLVQAPSGYKCWIGVTHQKSKFIGFDRADEKEAEQGALTDNPNATKADKTEKVKEAKLKMSREASAWRSREAKRTHQIIKELEKTGPDDVILLGDMNDELGEDESEQGEGGGDSIANLVGPAADGLTLVTQPLVDRKEISFGGYSRPDYRSFIDHVIVTRAMKDQVQDVQVFKAPIARVASDHYPVYVKIKADLAGPTTPP